MALDLHQKNDEKNQKESYDEIMKDIVTEEFPLDPLELLGEKSFDDPEKLKEMDQQPGSDVQEFYRDATIFITGGTGFMGKTLIEKLSRTCSNLRHIYLLIRNKKGVAMNDRLENIFEDRLFLRIKHERPKFFQKISAIAGDVSLPGLGLSSHDRQKLANEVNVIFHGAATVKFNEHIRIAININVLGTREIIKLAKEMTKLKVCMHVSTAYSNCIHDKIEEKSYQTPYNYDGVIALVNTTENDIDLDSITPSLLGKWPNTYTFTKALAENLAKNESAGLPFGIFRPSVIISTYNEPVRGWIDNVYGPIGICVGVGSGVIHTHLCDDSKIVDFVPVDLVVSALICAAHKISKSATTIEKNPTIFNFVSSKNNPINLGKFIEAVGKHSEKLWPTFNAVWYYSFIPTRNPYLYALLSFLLHTIPGHIIDFLSMVTGKKPKYSLTCIYEKIRKSNSVLSFFANKQWDFHDDNTRALWNDLSEADRKLFFFDLKTMSWDRYAQTCFLGLRVYLMNDDLYTLKAARIKWNKLYIAHRVMKMFMYALFIQCAWILISTLLGSN